MKYATFFAASLLAAPVVAEPVTMEAEGTVAEAVERLTAALENAGATVFATVDHAGGAADVDMELPDSTLVIFGNPQLGTPVMQEDIMAGLALPLEMLIYAEGETTMVAYEPIADMLADFNVPEDLGVLEQIAGAQERLANATAGGT